MLRKHIKEAGRKYLENKISGIPLPKQLPAEKKSATSSELYVLKVVKFRSLRSIIRKNRLQTTNQELYRSTRGAMKVGKSPRKLPKT